MHIRRSRRSRERRRLRRYVLGAVGSVCLLAAGCGFSEPALSPITPEPPTTVPIPGLAAKTGIFDVMAIDQRGHRLYLADGLKEGIDVFDISRAPGRFLTRVPVGAIPNGMVYVGRLGQLFVANDNGTVAAVDTDLKSKDVYHVLWQKPLAADGAADLIGYEPVHHKLYVTNPENGSVTVVDAHKGSTVAEIPNVGFTGQPRFNPRDRMVYLANGDRNSIMKINPATDKVATEYVLPVECEPHGMAIDAATNQALIGCQDKDRDHQITVAWDFATEKVIRTFEFAGAGDEVTFDPVAKHFYFAAHNYNPPEIAVFSTNPIVFLTAVPTSAKSHGVAYDEAHKLIYTYDGRHGEAAVWAFLDPVAGCVGQEAAEAAAGDAKTLTPHCQPASTKGAPLRPGASGGGS